MLRTRIILVVVCALIIWALFLVVTAKYVAVLLRADNHGEGGTLALMALANRATGGHTAPIILLGIVSGALFYGDAMITPAVFAPRTARPASPEADEPRYSA